eukprot:TRINITY_DN9675_c0_g1_i2.p1 TRINITY_DN9675_c0_g1~~TRINITY_DN9675_c0_g1_i2.p1  ORF type:complete len:248 (-),score=46.08 TRINITY_DN9675_c0_g1_i2:196-855(-)
MAAVRRQQRRSPAAAPMLLGLLASTSSVILLSRHSAFVAPKAERVQGTQGAALQRREALTQALRLGVGVASVSQVLPDSAQAMAGARWSGSYTDPKHPGCERRIIYKKDKYIVAGESATDGSKGCNSDTPTKKWQLVAQVAGGPRDAWSGPADEILIDFSPKGGPKDAVATWDKDGILFPDGNKWKKVKKTVPEIYRDGPPSPGDPDDKKRLAARALLD